MNSSNRSAKDHQFLAHTSSPRSTAVAIVATTKQVTKSMVKLHVSLCDDAMMLSFKSFKRTYITNWTAKCGRFFFLVYVCNECCAYTEQSRASPHCRRRAIAHTDKETTFYSFSLHFREQTFFFPQFLGFWYIQCLHTLIRRVFWSIHQIGLIHNVIHHFCCVFLCLIYVFVAGHFVHWAAARVNARCICYCIVFTWPWRLKLFCSRALEELVIMMME